MLQLLFLSAFASATTAQTVSITVNGNRNQQVIVDSRTWDINNNNSNNISKTITLTNLRPGEHTIHVLRLNDHNVNDDANFERDNNRNYTRNTGTFTVREGFDIAIVVAPNGLIQVKDKQITGTTSDPRIAMTDAVFAGVLQDIQFHWRNARKITAAQTAFTNNNNYFTTMQVRQVLQSVAGDANRLTLAKLAYNRVVDPGNFVQIYNLISTENARNELLGYVRSLPATTVITSYSENFRQAMNDATVDLLVADIERNWHPSARVNAVTEIVANQTNYFTTAQVRRLLEKVDYESNRLQLLKQVYTHVVDPGNFSLLYNLLTTDAAKIELINHVKTAAENGGLVNYNLNRPAMDSTDFKELLLTLQNQPNIPAGNPLNYVTLELADISNYFTAQQVARLLNMFEGELTRLSLAKAAYRGIVDPENFMPLIDDLLATTPARNELMIYAYSYRPQ